MKEFFRSFIGAVVAVSLCSWLVLIPKMEELARHTAYVACYETHYASIADDKFAGTKSAGFCRFYLTNL